MNTNELLRTPVWLYARTIIIDIFSIEPYRNITNRQLTVQEIQDFSDLLARSFARFRDRIPPDISPYKLHYLIRQVIGPSAYMIFWIPNVEGIDMYYDTARRSLFGPVTRARILTFLSNLMATRHPELTERQAITQVLLRGPDDRVSIRKSSNGEEILVRYYSVYNITEEFHTWISYWTYGDEKTSSLTTSDVHTVGDNLDKVNRAYAGLKKLSRELKVVDANAIQNIADKVDKEGYLTPFDLAQAYIDSEGYLAVKNAGKGLITLKDRDAFERWKAQIKSGLNSQAFAKASLKQKIAILIKSKDMTAIPLDVLNDTLADLYNSNENIPQYTNDSDQPVIFRNRLDIIVPNNVLPRQLQMDQRVVAPINHNQQISVNDQEPYRSELLQFQDYIFRIINEEEAQFPGDNRVLTPLNILNEEMVNMSELWIMSLPSLGEYIDSFNVWRRELANILLARRNLGRRCRNEEDPLTFEDIDDIPDTHFIHLSNGNCWDIESLMDYIRNKGGFNDARDLNDYGSPRIWEARDEQNILNHPLAIKTGFPEWIRAVREKRQREQITEETMNVFYNTAQVLVSRGPYYMDQVQEYLDPNQYEIFMKYTGGNIREYDRIPKYDYFEMFTNDIPPEAEEIAAENYGRDIIQSDFPDLVPGSPAYQNQLQRIIQRGYANGTLHIDDFLPDIVVPIRRIIYNIVVVRMKRDAVNSFHEYYNSLPEETRMLILDIESGFENDLNSCYREDLCVFVWARIILRVLNRFREIKNLPEIILDTSE